MSKLYFLVPEVSLAEQIVTDLKTAGVAEDDIGVLAGDEALVEKLPEPDVTETSDVKPALRQGAAIGGATGLIAGLAAAVVPGGFAVGGAALLGSTLAGGAFGAWASSMIGISVPNREVEQFQAAIERGQLLMIVGATDVNADRVKQIVSGRHPNVVYGGEEGSVQSVA